MLDRIIVTKLRDEVSTFKDMTNVLSLINAGGGAMGANADLISAISFVHAAITAQAEKIDNMLKEAAVI